VTAGLGGAANAAPMLPQSTGVSAESAGLTEVGCRRHCSRQHYRHYRHYDRYYHHRHRSRSNFSLSFSFGSPGYYAPSYYAPSYYAPPRVVYYTAWTPAWYTYCKTKYRSFNPHTGRYLTYSGEWHLCR
jgi:hypothetical protein